MKINCSQLDFESVNSQKDFSLKMKIFVLGVALLFIFMPLYEISPEIFQTNEVINIYYDCFGMYIKY